MPRVKGVETTPPSTSARDALLAGAGVSVIGQTKRSPYLSRQVGLVTMTTIQLNNCVFLSEEMSASTLSSSEAKHSKYMVWCACLCVCAYMSVCMCVV